MKKLYEIMKKYGLNSRPVQLGYSYFFGAEIAADGAHIYIPHGCEAGCDFARFQRYCSRYGYALRQFGVYPDCTVYSVCRCDDAERLVVYARHMQQSAEACAKAMHDARQCGEAAAQINSRLRAIMAEHEAAYLAEIGLVSAA